MGRYEERIALHGFTRRERSVSHMKDYLNRRLPESISYKDVKINGVDTQIIVDRSTQVHWKKIRTMPGEHFYIGDYVEWANCIWLITEVDPDDELYHDGVMYRCNYKLKWQDETGAIIERWARMSNASAYNTGKKFYLDQEIGTNQLLATMPLDEDTAKIIRDKRFYCDFMKNKMCYQVTRTDAVSDSYNNGKIVNVMLSEDLTHHDADREDLELCDYFDPMNPSPTEENPIASSIDYCAKYIKCNGTGTEFKAVFTDVDGNIVSDIEAQWDVETEANVSHVISGNTITLSCSDRSAVGQSILLKIVNEGMESSLELSIRSSR